MSANPEQPKTYHHGDLRAAALKEGRRILAEEPEGDVSLRAIARSVGVAHRALYRHFADLAAFEAALAAEAFEELAQAVEQTSDPAAFLKAYAAFALDQPGLYALTMRQTTAAMAAHPLLRRAVDRMIAASVSVLAAGDPDPDAARRAVMRLWMLAHGGVSLHRAGMLRDRDDAAFIAELVKIAGLEP